jgi:hypothetical protein
MAMTKGESMEWSRMGTGEKVGFGCFLAAIAIPCMWLIYAILAYVFDPPKTDAEIACEQGHMARCPEAYDH